ncbi:hypothetical protein NFI96_014419, partial [Prochilodus magdalenae]
LLLQHNHPFQTHPQAEHTGNSEHTSPSLTLSTGCPQGIVLSPLLYTLYTHDCTTTHSSNTIIKFADETTTIGNIIDDDEGPYREEVQLLTEWCAANNLSLNVSKTKELIIDFRKGGRTHTPLNTGGTRQAKKRASSGTNIVSVKSKQAKGNRPQLSSDRGEPSCVSMKSDQSKGNPPELHNERGEPSCVSMKSDQSKGNPPELHNERGEPSCVSMKSDQSKGNPPELHNERGEPSCVSMKSDQSKGNPPQLSNERGEPSCVSMKSDQSKGNPPQLSNERGEPSCVSMKSDQSKGNPPELHNERGEPSCVSMKSNQSKGNPPELSNDCLDTEQNSTEPALQINTLVEGTGDLHQDSHQPVDDVLHRVLQRHRTSMKNKYESLFEGTKTHENKTLLNRIYTQLYIIEGESEGVNEEHEVLQMERTPRRHLQDTPINCLDIFKPLQGSKPDPEEQNTRTETAEGERQKSGEELKGQKIRSVLTKGIAGIGKTVSVQKFILDWAEGKANQDVELMFVLPFRELNLIKEDPYSLHGLLCDFHPEIKDLDPKVHDQIKAVFIFDGLDESRIPLDFEECEKVSDITMTSSVGVLMTNLIKGELLPSALIWITSRPAAANQIPPKHINRVTEIQGFSDPQKEEYFRRRISDEDQAERIISHIKTVRSLHIMCHIPVFCWISATVLQQIMKQGSTEIPRTLTEMYSHFLLTQTHMKNEKYEEKDERDPKNLLESNRTILLKLAELAFKQLMKSNVMFYEEDLRESSIDVTDASVYSGIFTEIFREECGLYQRKVYCFVHLSFQEFLAAVYVIHCYQIRNMEDLRILIPRYRERSEDDPLDELLKGAVDKAVESQNGHLDLFLRFLLGISLESNQRLLHGLLTLTDNWSEATRKHIKRIIKGEIKQYPSISTERSINLFLCLSEMNDQSLSRELQEFLHSEKHSVWLSPGQCSALAYMLLTSEEVLDELDLKKYNTSEGGYRRLIPAVTVCRKARLNDCNLTKAACKILCSALQSVNSSLKELVLSNNDLQDAGVELLSAGLKSLHCKLEILRLSGCMVTDKGCFSLASALKSNPLHLNELDLTYNHPGQDGVKLLSDLKKDPHCALDTLRVEHGGEIRMKPGLKKYACKLTLDPNTASSRLSVFEDNRKVRRVRILQLDGTPPDHPDRFEYYQQVLCRESLTGRCYWEAEWSAREAVVAMTYKQIRRKGLSEECEFGSNSHSWRLFCSKDGYSVRHNNQETTIHSPSLSNRVGVYLDWESGTLSFYTISSKTHTPIHLHTFTTTFTEPLYAGIKNPAYTEFITVLANQDVDRGGEVVLSCEVNTPDVTAAWEKDGRKLCCVQGKHSMGRNGKVFKLTIKNTEEIDEGKYTLTLQNFMGSTSCSATVTLEGGEDRAPKPSSPQPPEEVEPLVCLPDQAGSVVAPGEVVAQVNTQAPVAGDHSHRRPSDMQGEFKPDSPISEDDDDYITNPSLNDRIHCLVSVVAADRIALMDNNVISKMKVIRTEASKLGIPQVTFLTRVDLACIMTKADLSKIYQSKRIKTKMQECSNILTVPMNCIFPVKNYHEETELNEHLNSSIAVNATIFKIASRFLRPSRGYNYTWLEIFQSVRDVFSILNNPRGCLVKRGASPEPSCVSMKRHRSMEKPPSFSRGGGGGEPSWVSMKSDRSMPEPPSFSRGGGGGGGGGETSCVSMKSDWSMPHPPEFSRGGGGGEPSCVSMKSDRSMPHPPEFSRGGGGGGGGGEPSWVSMKSDRSMPEPPSFSRGGGGGGGGGEPSCVSMKSDQSMPHPPVFSGGGGGGEPSCVPMKALWQNSTEPALQINTLVEGTGDLHLDSHQPVDEVLHRVLQRHRTSMKNKYESLFEGTKTQENKTLLNRIYTQLYIIEGESEGVNEEHEVLQMERTPRRHLQDTPINCLDIFKPLQGSKPDPEGENSRTETAEGERQKSGELKGQKIRSVLTKGIAGIGKTVSVQKFILDWAEGKANQDVELMFVLPFRELNLIRDDPYSLHGLLCDFHPEIKDLDPKIHDQIKAVFIFDGLDESRIPLDFEECERVSDITMTSSVGVLMTNLIKGELLPSALIWITSRPAAANQIPPKHINRVTEIQGFSDPQKEEYFRRRISDEDQAERIISHIKTVRSLHIMCHIPVFCWISATVLQQIMKQGSTEIPRTLTEMYSHFLLTQTHMKNEKYEEEDERDPKNLLESNRTILLKLAELAFKQLMKGNVMFYEEDLRESSIDVTDASVYSGIFTEIFREECGLYQRKVYCFVHLSFQEFLAAVYVIHCYQIRNMEDLQILIPRYRERSEDDPLQRLKLQYREWSEDDPLQRLNLQYRERSEDDPLDEVLKGAVDKAVESQNGHLDLFLRFLLGISLESNQRLLQGLLTPTQSRSERTAGYIKRLIKGEDILYFCNMSTERSINLFLCLFEMNDQSLSRELQEFLHSEKHSEVKLSPGQCSALACMLLTSEEVNELDLKKYNTSQEGYRRLIPAVTACRKVRVDHGESIRIVVGLKKYFCELTLNPNTVSPGLCLCEGNRKVRWVRENHWYPDDLERFDHCNQVLSVESLTGRCCWEVEWSGKAAIAVAYKGITRKGGLTESGFGYSTQSWSLECSGNSYSVRHNNQRTVLPDPPSPSNRLRMYLDWGSGVLSFYAIPPNTHRLIHLHTFTTTFTEPLYAGFWIGEESSVHLCGTE